jgi:hypothetical protein
VTDRPCFPWPLTEFDELMKEAAVVQLLAAKMREGVAHELRERADEQACEAFALADSEEADLISSAS